MKAKTRFSLAAILLIAFLLASGCDSSVNYKPPAGSKGTAITHYSFGKMTIDGKDYDGELTIKPGREVKNWSIDLGSHMLDTDDLTPLIIEGVKTVIIGTGNSGAVDLSEEVRVQRQLFFPLDDN